MRRRAFLKLAVMGSPLLLPRCAESPASMEVNPYLRARPRPVPSPSAPTSQPQRLRLGIERDGVFYAPAKTANAPLLLFLHGAGGIGERAIRHLGDYANRTGAIVLAPDSRDRTWGVVSGDEAADVAFLDRALNQIFASYSVDARRIVIGGFSDGASAALSWGLLNGELFSGIAAFSPGFINLSAPPRGMPKVFVSHGENDSILPVERCGRRIAHELKESGYTVRYEEFDGDHEVPPAIRDAGLAWLAR